MNRLILPLPPTDNRLRIPARNRLIKSPEYREWGEQAHRHWLNWQRQNPNFKPYNPSKKEQMEFEYQVFLPNWKSDIFNYNKAIADFLGGNKDTPRLFLDDHYVSLSLVLPVTVDAKHPRVEINPVPFVTG